MEVVELFAKLGLDVDEGAFSAAQAAIGGLRKGLLAVGAGFVGMGVAFAGAVRATANQGDNIDEVATRAGVAADTLQRLAYGAKFSGVGIEQVADAMNYLGKKGIKDVGGELLKISDQMQKLPAEGGARAKLAFDRLGKSGKSAIPWLVAGKEQLKAWGDEAEASGAIMSASLIKESAEFNDSVDRTNAALVGLRNTIIGPFLGPLREVIDGFREWMIVNRQLISDDVRAALRFFATGVKYLGAVLKPVVGLLGFFTSSALRLRWLLAGLASVMIYQLLPATLLNGGAMGVLTALTTEWGRASLIAGARAAAAPILAALPWILLIGVIGLVIDDIYTAATGGRSLFGEWQKFLQIDPEDSPFVKGLKTVGQILVKLLEYTNPLVLLMKGANQVRDLMDWHANGAAIVQGQQLHEQQRQAQLRAANQPWSDSGPWALPAAPASSTSVSVRPTPGSGPVLQVGDVHITATGDGKQIGEAFTTHIKEFWNSELSNAHAAVD